MSVTPAVETALRTRAESRCELCGAPPEAGYALPDSPSDGAECSVLLCSTCGPQLQGEVELDPKHWFCLQEAAWSEVPAVQVASWRLLQRLRTESWAHDLAEQVYLPEDVLAWAQAGAPLAPSDAGPITVDSNGTPLADGDSVTLIRNLDVKGANFVAKQGTLVKNIRLTDNPEHVEGRVNKVAIVLKTCFLKKATERS